MYRIVFVFNNLGLLTRFFKLLSDGNIIQSTRPWTISGTIWTVLDIVVRL